MATVSMKVRSVIQSLMAAVGLWLLLTLGGLGQTPLAHGGQSANIKAQRAQVEAEYKAAKLAANLEARWGSRATWLDPLDYPRLNPEENRLVVQKPSRDFRGEVAAVPKLPSPEQAKKRLAELHGLLDAIDNFEISKR